MITAPVDLNEEFKKINNFKLTSLLQKSFNSKISMQKVIFDIFLITLLCDHCSSIHAG